MKLRNLLPEDLQKDKWIVASDSDLKQFANDIYLMIKNTYAGIGGHPNFKSPSDINKSDANHWELIDLDDDPEPDAVSGAKLKPSGTKYVVGANDGSSAAKREYIKSRITKLKKNGNYVEASHKLHDILVSGGVPVVTDPEVIQKVMKGKELKFLGDGWYERKIGGSTLKKRLLGRPRV